MKKTAVTILIALMVLATNAEVARAFVLSAAPKNITNGLLGYWTFDGKDLVNGRQSDVSGNANPGYFKSIATSTFFQSGKVGQAGFFDGTDGVEILNESNFDFTSSQPFTVSTWFRVKTTAPLAQQLVSKMIENGNFTGWTVQLFDGTNSDTLNFTFISTLSNYLDVRGPANGISANTWYHLVVTYDGSALASGVKMYLNGQSQTITTVTNTLSGSTLNNQSVTLGYRYDPSAPNTPVNPLYGNIDDTRVYNRVLSAAEAKQLYQQSLNTLQASNDLRGNGGLVGYWTFDGADISNGTIKDMSGNGRTGFNRSISSSTFYAQGLVGQGARLDGVNDYVDVTTSLPTSYPITISAWFKPAASSATGQTVAGMSGAPCGCFTNSARKLIYLQNGIVSLYSEQDGGASSFFGTKTAPANQWTHAVAVFAAANDFRLYVNGVLDTTDTANTVAFGTLNTHFQIGVDSDTLNNTYFNGTVDDVRLYNKTLSASEISQLYSQGQAKLGVTSKSVTGLSSGLVGQWTFDGKDVTTGRLIDKSGNGNTMYFGSIATSSFYTQGKVGQGAQFDGVNDYGVVSSLNLSGTDKVTVAMWLYKPVFANDDQIALELSANASANNGFSINPNSGVPASGFFQVNDRDTTNNCSYITRPSAGAWHHYIIVMDRSQSTANENTMYVDGVAQSVTACAGQSFDTSANFPNTNLYLMSRAGSSLFSAGKVDDLRIYNRALSAGEAKQLYLGGR